MTSEQHRFVCDSQCTRASPTEAEETRPCESQAKPAVLDGIVTGDEKVARVLFFLEIHPGPKYLNMTPELSDS